MVSLAFSTLLLATPFGALLFFLGGNQLGLRGCWRLTLLLGFLQLLALASFLGEQLPAFGSVFYHFDYGLWFSLGQSRVSFSFVLDNLALLMVQLVLLVSLVTQLYSYYYLAEEPQLIRFQGNLQLFTFAMLLLVLADNLVVLFLGWEGVGLCSYLLISFWSSRPEARLAGLKAVAVNRVGDCALMAAAGLLFAFGHSFDYAVIFNLLPQLSQLTLSLGGLQLPLLELVALLLLLAAAAKSAQLGLHTWLADAMEGPTPVSALIHAATMVTAGIFLIIRLNPLFGYAPLTNGVMAYLGGYTALFGALTAAQQWDIKKIIAYSTASQLGYMLCACGFGGYSVAFYHLVNHGYFKALLFLAAGVLIHNLGGEQDIRRMGGLFFRLPLVLSYFLVGSASLVGLPGTAGFASKEKILDYLSVLDSDGARACYGLLLGALFFTAYYSAKTIYYVFLRPGHYGGGALAALRRPGAELPLWVLLPLSLLVFLSLWADSLLFGPMVALQGYFLESTAAQGVASFGLFLGEPHASAQRYYPLLTALLSLLVFVRALVEDSHRRRRASLGTAARAGAARLAFFQRGFSLDYSQNFLVALVLPALVRRALLLEKGFGEHLGPAGLEALGRRLGALLAALHSPRRTFAQVSLLFALLLPLLLLLQGAAGPRPWLAPGAAAG